MSIRFHIKENGEPGQCRAKQGNCPRGGDSGSENHFDTIEEAQAYVNKKYEEQYGLTTTLKKNTRSNVEWDSRDLSLIREEIIEDLSFNKTLEVYISYNDYLSDEQIDKILESEDGELDVYDDVYEDYVLNAPEDTFDNEIGEYYYNDPGARQFLLNNAGYDEEELDDLSEEEFGEALRRNINFNPYQAVHYGSAVDQLIKNTPQQLMRTSLGNFDGLYASPEQDVEDYIVNKLQENGIHDTPEVRQAVQELMDNGANYGFHDGLQLEVYYRSSIQENAGNLERTVKVNEPYIALFDPFYGIGHDVKLSGETFQATVGEDSGLKVQREKKRNGLYSWTDTAGLYTPAYPEADIEKL